MSSFSQVDTTKVCLPTNIARQVAKDLVQYDGCKEELKLTLFKVDKLQEREIQKDNIISLLNDKDKNNQFIISQQGEQIDLYKNMTKDLTKELKGQKVKTVLWKIVAGAGGFLSVILLIQ